MGLNCSKFNDADSSIKRLFSAKARQEHRAQKERVQERIAQAREDFKSRRQQESKSVNLLLQQIQDEVHLEQSVKLRKQLPNVPRHAATFPGPQSKY